MSHMPVGGVWLAIILVAQDAASIRAAMEKPLRQQRESVWRQTHPVVSSSARCAPLPPGVMEEFVAAAAEAHHVDSGLVREVARAESGFKPCSLSPKGAQGIMQLMPSTQRTLGVGNPFDPEESIFAGTRLLGQLLQRYQGDIALTLGAYNAGPGAVERDGGVPVNPETQGYVALILGRLEEFRKHPNPTLRVNR